MRTRLREGEEKLEGWRRKSKRNKKKRKKNETALNPILETGPYGENFFRTSSLETKNGKLPIHTVFAGGFLGGADGVSYRCTWVVETVLDAPTTAPNLVYEAVCSTKACFVSFLRFQLWC